MSGSDKTSYYSLLLRRFELWRKTRRKTRRFVALAALVVCFSLGITLILSSLRENIVFFLVPSEFYTMDEERQATMRGRLIRLGGLVVADSLRQNATSGEVSFVLTDGEAQVGVSYRGLLPDLFREGQGVVVIGIIIASASEISETTTKMVLFKAERVLAKHDEYYMPRGLENILKERNLWRESSS